MTQHPLFSLLFSLLFSSLLFAGLMVVVAPPALAQDGTVGAPPYSMQLYLCLGASEAGDTATQDCLQRETRRQDSLLNGAYQALLSAMPAGQRPLLQRAQNQWWHYRDANCRLLGNVTRALPAIAHGNCMMYMTAQRASELESLLP